MKNKDRYDLREIDVNVLWTINGCGKKVSPRIIEIKHKRKEIASIRNENDPAIDVLMRWLEEED